MSVAAGIAQPDSLGGAGRDGEEDRRREHDAADRGDRRQRRGASLAQLAGDELALDLEADDEEEQRHQPVVDPMPQVLGKRGAADPDGRLVVPEADVGVTGGAVGPHDGDDRRGDERDATGGLLAQELRERVEHLSRLGLRRAGDVGGARLHPRSLGRAGRRSHGGGHP